MYTATSGMISQQQRHDMVTNNIANLQTTGYKKQVAPMRSFPEILMQRMNTDEGAPPKIGYMHGGVMMEESMTVFQQGDILETGNAFDFAIVSQMTEIDGEQYTFDESGKHVTDNGEVIYQPQAFFAVQNAQEEVLYTRAGSFVVGSEGQLMTASGEEVLNKDGQRIELVDRFGDIIPIQELVVNQQGQVVYNGDTLIDDLQLVKVNDPYQLIMEGNGLYRYVGDEQPEALTALDQAVVKQGFVERSNVDPSQEMVEMMSALRLYEANQKMVQYYDRNLEKAVNEIGKV